MKTHYNCFKRQVGCFALGFLSLGLTTTVSAMNNIVQIDGAISGKLPKPQYQNALGTFLVDFNTTSISISEFQNGLNDYFGLDKDHRFELLNTQQDKETGFTHYKYQHFYKDVKVHGDMIFLHVKEGKVKQVNGQLIVFKDIATKASVSEEKLLNVAFDNFGTTKNVKVGKIETYILKEQNQEGGVQPKLVNKVNLTSIAPLKSHDFIIDAQSGTLISHRNKVYKADTPSTSATYNRGNKSLIVDSYNGSFRLRDNARKIRTFNGVNLDGDVNSDGTFTGYKEYTSATANFTANNTKPAVEVHWAMQQTYDYYKNIHNRNSFDGNNHYINNYYDIGNMVGDHENAFALDEIDGTDEYIGMFYGKGSADMHPVINLDVAGHEFSHLVVSRNGSGGLDYENESGALNESFADIFGTAIEFYVNDAPNWTMGEGMFKNNATPNYFRNMGNPNYVDINNSYPQPDTYEGTHWMPITNNPDPWNDYGGVHINSGVGNFWFYLLSVGGKGKNDIGNNYYVTGITIQKAEKIAYKALMTGLTNTATYLDAFNATKQAAAAIYGINSEEWNQVVNAWYAVGIGNAPASTTNFEMKSKINVYPNPVLGDEVTIESNLEEMTSVSIYDLQGKLIMSPMNIQEKSTINVATFASGVYLLKFKTSSGEYTHKLVVK